ncbi:MAG: hypothetical protein WBD69_10335 [Candidatus Cybelea sp.]
MSDKRYWFRRRRFGLGWSPKSWEGWAATGGFVLLQAALPSIVERFGGRERRIYGTLRFGVTAAFVALAFLTGEPLG